MFIDVGEVTIELGVHIGQEELYPQCLALGGGWNHTDSTLHDVEGSIDGTTGISKRLS